MKIPRAINNLIEAFERLPGIGSKTAARLTFYLLHVPEVERQKLGQAVLELGEKTGFCGRCFNITGELESRRIGEFDKNKRSDHQILKPSDSQDPSVVLCDICSDPNRDQSLICVVEEPLDLMAFERTGKYDGLYHVLQGVIAPLEHIGPEDLKIDELMTRLKSSTSDGGLSQVKEVILATNPSLEGEATAMYIRQLISKQVIDSRQQAAGNSKKIKITRIARGIPTGGDLEYADKVTLTKALEGRQEY